MDAATKNDMLKKEMGEMETSFLSYKEKHGEEIAFYMLADVYGATKVNEWKEWKRTHSTPINGIVHLYSEWKEAIDGIHVNDVYVYERTLCLTTNGGEDWDFSKHSHKFSRFFQSTLDRIVRNTCDYTLLYEGCVGASASYIVCVKMDTPISNINELWGMLEKYCVA